MIGEDRDGRVERIPLGRIRPRAFAVRNDGADGLERLAASIRSHGLLHPLVLRPKDGAFEVVCGQRRLEAIRALGWGEVPAIVNVTFRAATPRAATIATSAAEIVGPTMTICRFSRTSVPSFDFRHVPPASSPAGDRTMTGRESPCPRSVIRDRGGNSVGEIMNGPSPPNSITGSSWGNAANASARFRTPDPCSGPR